MRKRCIVPGCDSEYRGGVCENGKRMTFFSPGTGDLRLKWSEAIPNLDRELKKRDFVCELHFEENLINKYFETKLKDGSTWRLERERPLLQKNALPTIFPGNSVTRQSAIADDSSLNFSHVDTAPNEVVLEGPFNFKVLERYVQSIKRPSEYWGITVHKSHLLCAKWSYNFTLEKRVIVNQDLSVEVFLKNRKITLHMDEIKSITDLSSFLEQIHLLHVCANIDDTECIGCSLFLNCNTRTKSSKFCEYCRVHKRKERLQQTMKDQRNRTLERARQKNRVLGEKVHNLNRKVSRLKNKVERLQIRLKEQKKWKSLDSDMKDLDSILSIEMSECENEVINEEALPHDNDLSTTLYTDE